MMQRLEGSEAAIRKLKSEALQRDIDLGIE